MESMQDASPEASPTIRARAWVLGERIEIRHFERRDTLALGPLTLRVGDRGCAVLFRFGAVVFIDADTRNEENLVRELTPFVSGRFDEPETEEAEIVIDPERGDGMDASGAIVLGQASIGRLQLVGDVLAKSAVLAHYEERVGSVFDRIETLARNLGRGLSPARGREILRELGSVLMIQTRTVGRVEVTEKPEITWEQPELDRLYERLAAEYELRDRDRALTRKLELVSRTAETYLNLLYNRRSIRVEWYIVILILVEIVLIVYDILAVR
jgi:uncharacterized Rmd1/YagE family protein